MLIDSNYLNCSGESMDFIQEVEAMWCIRHKNMVKLIGYCTEGTYKYSSFSFLL